MSGTFDEVHVFDGIGELTGVRVERQGVRGRRAVCRSLSELTSKSRRLGDGYYYIASAAWPVDATSVNLALTWATMS